MERATRLNTAKHKAVGGDCYTTVHVDHMLIYSLHLYHFYDLLFHEICNINCRGDALRLQRAPGNVQGSVKPEFISTTMMSLSCLPAELLYMVFRRLENNSEIFAVSEVYRRFDPISRKVLERPRRTLPVEPIRIVRQLRRILNVTTVIGYEGICQTSDYSKLKISPEGFALKLWLCPMSIARLCGLQPQMGLWISSNTFLVGMLMRTSSYTRPFLWLHIKIM